MTRNSASPLLQLIRSAGLDQGVRELPDHELLNRFCRSRDEAAFQALLRRHGPMVLDVCRGVLGNEADAEDAFQATFLILARKVDAIRKRDSVGSWLHGVAYRTALKARTAEGNRRKHEARPRGYLLGRAVPAHQGLQALAFFLCQRDGSRSHLFRCSLVCLARPRAV